MRRKHKKIAVCKRCKTKQQHWAKGLCKRCYGSDYRIRHKKKRTIYNTKYNIKNKEKIWGPNGVPKPFLVRDSISSDGCNFDTAKVIQISKNPGVGRRIIVYSLKKEDGYKVQVISYNQEAWWRFTSNTDLENFLEKTKRRSFEYLTQ